MKNTISDEEYRKLRDRAIRHQNEQGGGSLSDKAVRYRKAHDPGKAATN